MYHKIKDEPQTSFVVRMGDRGRLVLPAAVRDQLGLHAGDRLVLFIDRIGELRIKSARKIAEDCCGMFAGLAPEKSLVDELIQERRQEARSEERE